MHVLACFVGLATYKTYEFSVLLDCLFFEGGWASSRFFNHAIRILKFMTSSVCPRGVILNV